MPQAQLADGTVLDFPDGTPDAVIDATVKKHLSVDDHSGNYQPAQKPIGSSLMNTVSNIAGRTARDVYEGIGQAADIPNSLINLATSQSNKYLGTDIGQIGYPSQLIKSYLDSVGVPDSSNPQEEIADSGAKMLAGSAAFPGEQTLKGALSAAGGGSAGEAAKQSGAGPLGQSIATLAGGFAAPSLLAEENGPAFQSALKNAKDAEKPVTSDMIKSEANKAYQYADAVGGTIKPEAVNSFIDKVSDLAPQTTAGKLVGGENEFTKLVGRIQTLRDQPLTLQEAQEVDEHLGDIIDSHFENGKLSKIGKKISDVQDQFRQSIEDAASNPDMVDGGDKGFKALSEGRRLWAKQARLRDVEKIITRADMMDNPATGIKTGFRTLYNNPNRLRGFTDAQKKMIKNAAETGIVSDTLRTLGSRLNPIAALAGGGPIAGAIANAGSMAARRGATAIQVGKATKLAKDIAQDYKFKAP